VVVVGAGIVGSACAMECASRGLRTAVVEGTGVGSGATAAGMGHIVVMDDSPAQLALTHCSQKLWQDLSKRLPADVEYEACGTLWVATDEEEMREVRRKSEIYTSAGVSTEILDSQMLAEAEPQLRRPLAGALLVSLDAVLYPPCAAGFLMREAERMVRGFMQRKRCPQGRGRFDSAMEPSCTLRASSTQGARMQANCLQGCRSGKRKGHLVITDRYPGFVQHQLVELGYLKSAHSSTADSVAFQYPARRTGQVLIGSSRQFGAEEFKVDQEILAAMIERAQWYLPTIGALSCDPRLDRISSGNSRQAATYRPMARGRITFSGNGTRGTWYHHFTRDSSHSCGSTVRQRTGDSDRAVPAGTICEE